ncbi:MAG: SDR family NAD(P)-dependent oxidoreductase, partial [Pseudomonadales bacterium]|nr:SDR family NAD(P)-dependent oxidoreductase [Pseudomonadales bacterium]
MPWTEADVPDQSGRVAIVTGANTGIGFETARVLAERGAEVVLACRDAGKGEVAAQRLRQASPDALVAFDALDLADLDSVAAFAERFSQTHQRLDLLVNNAGVMVPPAARTAQGFELQFGVNHLGHFALTGRLLAKLAATAGARVVNVASLAHRLGRIRFDDLQFDLGYEPWPA